MSLPGYCVSVETDAGGSGVMSDQRHGVIAYIHGHQSHHADQRAVALLAPSAGGNGVAVMRSFTGDVLAVSDCLRTASHPPIGCTTGGRQ